MLRFTAAAVRAALLASFALSRTAPAQTFPPSQGLGVPPALLSLPVPPGGCVWAGRAFSEGAGFCFAPRVIMKCNGGKWSYDTLDACTNTAPVDTR